VDFSSVLRLFFDRTGDYQTTSAYVQNTNFLLDERLRLTYGVKYLRIDADFANNGATEPGAATTPDLPAPARRSRPTAASCRSSARSSGRPRRRSCS
jgi:hypothetical protein